MGGGIGKPGILRIYHPARMRAPKDAGGAVAGDAHSHNGGMLPGDDLARRGLADLADGVESDTALLVSIGALRLRAPGVEVLVDPESLRRAVQAVATST
jgi:hypothetical protein